MDLIHLPQDRVPILRVRTLPNDTNQSGAIFGGWLMCQIDIAGAIIAADRAKGQVATIAVKELRFLKPLYVYDLVSFYVDVTAVGSSSITVKIEVFAQRAPLLDEVVKVSDATLVFVAVSKPGEKRQVPQ